MLTSVGPEQVRGPAKQRMPCHQICVQGSKIDLRIAKGMPGHQQRHAPPPNLLHLKVGKLWKVKKATCNTGWMAGRRVGRSWRRHVEKGD